MANFTITDDARFEGDVKLEPVAGYVPSGPEANYLVILARVTSSLESSAADDPSDAEKRVLADARKARRKATGKALRKEAEAVIEGRLNPDFAADNALVIKGMYNEKLLQLGDAAFVVDVELDEKTKLAVDLNIFVGEPIDPKDQASPEKHALFAAIDGAVTSLRAACQRIETRGNRQWATKTARELEANRAKRIMDQYLRKLAGIARIGLEGSQVQLATLALDGMRADFVAQEAGRIKNAYIRSLGLAAGIAALLCFGTYAIIEISGAVATSFWVRHQVFLLAAGGAAVGTWLSFSIRRVTLAYEELGRLEDDLLDPSIRVLFVTCLTVTVCLLFWTGAMNVEIGNLKTDALNKKTAGVEFGAVALLVGIFCGIAERALATAVSGRAAAFVRGIGGG
jgi:hypothetical protein